MGDIRKGVVHCTDNLTLLLFSTILLKLKLSWATSRGVSPMNSVMFTVAVVKFGFAFGLLYYMFT